MTKADIIERVYEKVGGFSKKEAAEIVEAVFQVMKHSLRKSRSPGSATSSFAGRRSAWGVTRRPDSQS
jgi:integration host factor subunit alpha